MSARRRGAWKLVADERTADMPLEVLQCRRTRHAWVNVPVPAERRAELRAEGMAEFRAWCPTCKATVEEMCLLPDFETLYRHVKYEPDYLIPKKHAGKGRLTAAEVKKALYLRMENEES